MKTYCLALAVLVCSPASLSATGQESEILIYRGLRYPTPVHPLESCPATVERDFQLEPGVWNTANLRGYVGTWEIAENKLWLIGIDTWVRDKQTQSKGGSSSEFKRASLEGLFPGQIRDGRVHASWFTGRIFSPGSRWGLGSPDEDQEAKARLVIVLSEGIVRRIEACDIAHLPLEPTIACYGDSITAGAHLAESEKYPAVLQGLVPDSRVLNFGVGGNTSSQGRVRFEKTVKKQRSALSALFAAQRELTLVEDEILAAKPDVVVFFFGTNDSVLTGEGQYRVPLEKYRENLRQMVLECRKINAEPILCTLPPIIAEPYFTRHPKPFYDAEGGLAAIVERYRAAVLDLGRELHVPVVDLYAVFEKDTTLLRPAPDGVHPNGRGARVIAEEIARLFSPRRRPVPLEPMNAEAK